MIVEVSEGDFTNFIQIIDVVPIDAIGSESRKTLQAGFSAAVTLFDVLPSEIKSMVKSVVQNIINGDLNSMVKRADDLPADINIKKMLKKAVDDGYHQQQQSRSSNTLSSTSASVSSSTSSSSSTSADETEDQQIKKQKAGSEGLEPLCLVVAVLVSSVALAF